jgi:hypothetical protein
MRPVGEPHLNAMKNMGGAIYQGLRNSIAGGKTESEWAEYEKDPSGHAVMAIADEMDKVPGIKRLK